MVKIGNLVFEEFPLLLAPMEDVSDPPFRLICKKYGADLMYTEFISSDALVRNAEKSIKKLEIFEHERPIGIQIFGDKAEEMKNAAILANSKNPDLIDINYGCPVKKIACKGAGAGLLKDLDKMQHITDQVVKASIKPVTVKTRLGWDENSINILEAAKRLVDVGIQALTIHGRTRSQMYKGSADWTLIGEVKNLDLGIPIFGNGDVDSPQKAYEYKNRYGVDGIMIGRASIGYPWIFREIKHFFKTGELLPPPDLKERLAVILQHLNLSIEWKGEKIGIYEMRPHYTNYLRGINGIKPFRLRLVEAKSKLEIEDILGEIEHLSNVGDIMFENQTFI